MLHKAIIHDKLGTVHMQKMIKISLYSYGPESSAPIAVESRAQLQVATIIYRSEQQ